MRSDSEDHVVLYASDHGFGHAARMLALASRLAEEGYAVTLCAGAAVPMLRAALPFLKKPIEVRQASLDPGLVAKKGALDFDMQASKEVLSVWLSRLPHLVKAEADFLVSAKTTLVIADAPAAALLAAARTGIAAVVCSNFTWLDMYAGRFGEAMDAALRDAYGAARFGLRLRLGRMALEGLSTIIDVDGVLARPPIRSRALVREELLVKPDESMVGLGLGGSLDPALYDAIAASAPGRVVRLLSPSPGAVIGVAGAAHLHFPTITPDPQSYFGACDLVLAKAGYSTLAEAALAGVPLCVFPLRNSPESVRLAADVEILGLGVSLFDEAAAIGALADPVGLIQAARRAFRGPMPDAAPLLVSVLRSEGLLTH